ncbi:hypothetical protein DFH09DRAFT_1460692 [Mycena vulgaris]|nr:hypothetical protein DFH09DRAFT_1460692 [Mycena vulgaris]
MLSHVVRPVASIKERMSCGRLHDSAEDVAAFLAAIFDSSYFMPPSAPVEIYPLLGILRLANKYDVQYLYRRASDHLKMAGWYTGSPEEPYATHMITPPNSTASETLSICAAAAELLSLMEDARLAQHARKCLDAHVHMVRGTVAVNEFLCVPSTCSSAAACGGVRNQLLSELFTSVKLGRDCDPVYGTTPAMMRSLKTWGWESVSAFCDNIPSVYGLPSWAELRAMNTTAMSESDGEGSPHQLCEDRFQCESLIQIRTAYIGPRDIISINLYLLENPLAEASDFKRIARNEEKLAQTHDVGNSALDVVVRNARQACAARAVVAEHAVVRDAAEIVPQGAIGCTKGGAGGGARQDCERKPEEYGGEGVHGGFDLKGDGRGYDRYRFRHPRYEVIVGAGRTIGVESDHPGWIGTVAPGGEAASRGAQG